MKGLTIYAVVVSVVAVGAIGVAVGFVVARATEDSKTEVVQATAVPTAVPTAQPTVAPTNYAPRLTGAEAASKGKSELLAHTATEAERLAVLKVVCNAEDFNKSDKSWIVNCSGNGITFRFKVDDQTGSVTLLG